MYQTPIRRWAAEPAARVGLNTQQAKVVAPVQLPVAVAPNAGILSLLTLLSSREHQIAALVARGLSNKEVAMELDISPWTVSAHLRRIFTKLDIRRRIELCLLMAQC